MWKVLWIRESWLSIDTSHVKLCTFLLTCWMRNGLNYLGLSFLDVFKRLMFSVKRRTLWLPERSGGTDRFLLAFLACLILEEYRLREMQDNVPL